MREKISINLLTLASVLIFYFGVIGTAGAAIHVTTDEADWITAVSGYSIQDEDFSFFTGSLPANDSTDIGLFNVAITGNSDTAGGQFPNGYIGVFGGQFQGDVDEDYNLTIVFENFDNPPVFGFAGYWESTTSGDFLTVSVNGFTIEFGNYLGYNQFNEGTGGSGFLGLWDDASPITLLTFSTESGDDDFSGEGFTLGDVRIASQAVPAPAAIFLLGAGLLGLAGIGRNRKE